jgi:hypothetical protein
MPIARHIFGRDKPSLTALVHGDGAPVERRRALGLRQLFQTVPLFGSPAGDDTTPASVDLVWRLSLAIVPVVAVALVLILVWFWV